MSSVSLYWKGFVAHAMKDEFKDLSKINKGRAKSMEARYRRVCVGYARLREQILEKKRLEGVQNPVVTRMDCWRLARTNAQGDVDDYRTLQILEDSVRISERMEEHELTDIGVNDLLARTMPSQYSGHLRGVGFGVTKESLTSMVPLSALAQLNKRLDDMDNKLKKMTKGSSPMMHSRGSSHMDKFDRDDDHMDECDNAHSSEDLPEGPVPCYLYLEPPRRYVGKGILHNSPDNHLHGVPLEDGHVRVQFEVGEDSEKDSCLPVCCDDAMTIGTAVGYFLSWPKKWVSLELECIPLRNSNKDQKKVSVANKDNHHQNTFESTVGVGSSRKELGYPKPDDIPHNNAIFDLLRVMVNNANLYTIQVRMDAYFDEVIWTDHIAKENILEALDD